ncbi:HET domain-containing protein [Fusarium sp. LHS14.1]|nr:HET domain-containing protein [Fusarium sp. LHS14.1]
MNLCTVCQQFCPELTPENEARIRQYKDMDVWIVKDDKKKIMHASWEKFADSLSQDCPICWSLWRLLRSSPLATPDEEKHNDFQSWVTEARAKSFGYFLEVELPGRETLTKSRSYGICKTTEKMSLETERCHPIPDIHTPESIARLIHSWSDDCLNKHPECKRRGTTSSTIPTRLLDLRNTDSGQWNIVENKGNVEEYRRYVALSHRWAENTPKLLKNGDGYQLQRLYHNSQLPHDYQDMMSICRALPIRYLWIDSLCIFQDSDADFHSEAGTMAHIYQNAFLTLSICWDYSAASLFRSIRPRTIPRTPPAEHPESGNGNSTAHSGDYAFVGHNWSFEIDVAKALINRRG